MAKRPWSRFQSKVKRIAINYLLLATFAVFSCQLEVCVAAELNPDFVITGLISQREKLFSGDLSVRGRETRFNTSLEIVTKREILDRLVFDLRSDLFRHEKELSYLRRVGDKEDSGPLLHEILVAGHDAVCRKSVEAKQIAIGQATNSPIFWDLRTFGMCTTDDMSHLRQIPDFDITFRRAHKLGYFSVEEQDLDDLIVAEMLFSYDKLNVNKIYGRRRMWIDPNRGFTCVKMEEQFNSRKAIDSGDIDWQEPHSQSTATWTNRDDIWVPTSATIEYKTASKGGTAGMKFELSFEWYSINEELDKDLFTLAGLDIPTGSHIITDERGGRGSVLVQHPGVPDAKMLKRIEEKNKESAVELEPEKSYGFLIANVVVVLFLVCLVLWRRAQ